MTDLDIRIVDVDEKNVDDALSVCASSSIKNEESYLKGCEIRKNWLLNHRKNIGPCAKIAYSAGKPVGVIQYTPLHAIPYFKTKKKDALYIHCIYVPNKYRRKGVGSALMDSLINEMSKPNKLFSKTPCRMLVTSARRVYGYTQVGLFMHKGFRRVKGNVDAGLVLPLSGNVKNVELDIPPSKSRVIIERGVKIFFKPTCQYCLHTNETVIKTEIRKVNREISIEEYNLWQNAEEAVRRGITCVATYINGKPILPMAPKKFRETLRRMASKAEIRPASR